MWGAIGAVAGSIISGLLNNHGVNSANEANLKLWREQAEYNKPINQLARLEEAGMNPNLIYGNGGVQNTISSAPKMESSRYDIDLSKLGALFAHQQLETADNNNALLEDRHSLNQERLKALRLENKYKEREINLLEESGGLRNDPQIFKYILRSGNYVKRALDEHNDYLQSQEDDFRRSWESKSNLDYTANPYPPVVYKRNNR